MFRCVTPDCRNISVRGCGVAPSSARPPWQFRDSAHRRAWRPKQQCNERADAAHPRARPLSLSALGARILADRYWPHPPHAAGCQRRSHAACGYQLLTVQGGTQPPASQWLYRQCAGDFAAAPQFFAGVHLPKWPCHRRARGWWGAEYAFPQFSESDGDGCGTALCGQWNPYHSDDDYLREYHRERWTRSSPNWQIMRARR